MQYVVSHTEHGWLRYCTWPLPYISLLDNNVREVLLRFACHLLLCSLQECVRGRALRSILAVRKVSREEAEKVVDEVFDSCFNDHAPFGRIPHSKKDAKFAYRDFENRDRYYANL